MPSFIPNIITPETTSDCCQMLNSLDWLQRTPFVEKIQPIRLAGLDEARESFVDMTSYADGWGKDGQTSSGTKTLKYAQLPVIANDEWVCTWQIDERKKCTADLGQSACQMVKRFENVWGDSGSPLLILRDNVPLQSGIVSYKDGVSHSETNSSYENNKLFKTDRKCYRNAILNAWFR
ncbi:tryptase-2-like [Augochlora pura]